MEWSFRMTAAVEGEVGFGDGAILDQYPNWVI